MPLQLGVDRVTPAYYESIKALFKIRQNVGLGGGLAHRSLYF